MPNFAGNKAYPFLVGETAMVDAGTRTKNFQTGFVRGGITEDYNSKLRGIGERIDKKPKRPYP